MSARARFSHGLTALPVTSPLITPGFHHITMVSKDAVRTLAFYGGLLGLPMVKKTVNFDDPGSYHLYFGNEGGAPGTILTFFEWPDSHKGHWGVGGVHHLALGVGDLPGLLKWKRRLIDAGVGVSGPIDRGYFTSLYFQDPDGQVLEITTTGPGYAVDEAPEALGARMIVPPAQRLPGGRDQTAIADSVHAAPVPDITDDMRLEGIHHITGITNVMERMGDFIEEALGLRLVKKTLNQDDGKTRHFFWANYDGHAVAPHSAWTLFDWPKSDYLARPGAGQTHHIAFRAKDRGQQEAWQEHLRAMGVEVTEVLDRNYFESIYFRAPDGMLLEIATDGPGFSVDEPLAQLGRGLQLPDWLEPRRDDIERSLTPL